MQPISQFFKKPWIVRRNEDISYWLWIEGDRTRKVFDLFFATMTWRTWRISRLVGWSRYLIGQAGGWDLQKRSPVTCRQRWSCPCFQSRLSSIVAAVLLCSGQRTDFLRIAQEWRPELQWGQEPVILLIPSWLVVVSLRLAFLQKGLYYSTEELLEFFSVAIMHWRTDRTCQWKWGKI